MPKTGKMADDAKIFENHAVGLNSRVQLSTDEFNVLQKIWQTFKIGGRRGFAKLVIEKELAQKQHAQNEPTHDNASSKPHPNASTPEQKMGALARALARAEENGYISWQVFQSVALGIDTEPNVLLEQLTAQSIEVMPLGTGSAWISDEGMHAQFSTMLHHYSTTGGKEDRRWVYTLFDFSRSSEGLLFSTARIETPESIERRAYGYMAHNILTLVIRNERGRDKKEAVFLYGDYKKMKNAPFGLCGVFLEEGSENNVGETLLLKHPFPCTERHGPQSPLLSGFLTNYWNIYHRNRGSRQLCRIPKIISGGQTGADRAALEFAIAHGIRTGGTCPKGGRATDGKIDKRRYQLAECKVPGLKARTRKNVKDADFTVIFSISPNLTKGSLYTETAAVELAKGSSPIHIHIHKELRNPVETLVSCLRAKEIEILNVAGPRADDSENHGIEEFVTLMLTLTVR
jgi:hypothetical protein